jgi:hypothetical protein
MKPIARYLEDSGMTADQLAVSSAMDKKLVRSIVAGNYTAGPADRLRLAAALGVSAEDIAWGHSVPVEHIRGNGPQSGRST